MMNAYEQIKNIIDTYGCITCTDVKIISGLPTDDPDDSNYGWTSLDAFVLGGDGIFLPPARPLISESDHKIPETNDPKPDMVNHPAHYKSESGLEAIDVIEAFTADLKGGEAVCTGNALKYICRWKHKNGVEDLKKAKWYLERLINKLEKETK
jgi:hypothetical protein